MARYNTTVTKKDGSKASGYIEDGRSYYDDGTSISAGDSVVDSTGKTWTKGGDTGVSNEISMVNNAIRANNSVKQTNSGIQSAIDTEKARRQSTYTAGEDALASLQKQMKQQELQRARANALSSLNAEEQATNQAYENKIKQTGTNADIALKNYFENVANRGQTYSGSTAQGEIAHNIARQNNISALQQAQASALADIARRRQLAEQGYIDDLQSASNAIDLKVLENRIAQEQADKEALTKAQEAQYEQEMNKAKLAAQYGDYSLLEGLTGMDLTYAKKLQETELAELARKAEQEQIERLLKAKDYNALKGLGIDVSNLQAEFDSDIAKAKADIANTQSLISSRNKKTKSTKYEDIYKEAKKIWETGNIDAESINNWLAMQDLSEAEHEKIITSLGVKAILDNLDRMGKLSY